MLNSKTGFKFKILGTGRAWPPRKFSNLDLLKLHPETSGKPDAFLQELARRIESGFGFDTRYLAHLPGERFDPSEATSESLALEASRKAIAGSPSPSLFLLGTTTSRRYTGSQAASVLGQLDLRIPAYELKAGCSTSLATLKLGLELLSPSCPRVLVSCAETLSKVIHPEVRDTWFGLADGGAAVLVEFLPNERKLAPGEVGFEVLNSFYSTDGRYVDLYTTPGDLPPRQEALDQGLYYLAGDANQMRGVAVKAYLEMIDILFPGGRGIDQLSYLLPHQVNRALIQEVCDARSIRAPWIWSAKDFGNLGGSSILFSLAEAIEMGRFSQDQQILLMSVGGGLSFAALHLKACVGS